MELKTTPHLHILLYHSDAFDLSFYAKS